MPRKCFLTFATLLIGTLSLIGQPSTPLEELINGYLERYPFTPENTFRLGAYLELKGKYQPEEETMTLDFGDLAQLTFYKNSCLLRAGRFGVYSLDGRGNRPIDIEAMNQALNAVFEQIFLMGNAGSNRNLTRLVDKYLIGKNLAPFDKILLHHILVRYGRYDSIYNRVELRTDWFPEVPLVYRDQRDRFAKAYEPTALYLKLDKGVVRGYYLRAGGTVYVEDVERDVLYATGEIQTPSSTAFRLFVQKLFIQSTVHLIRAEEERLARLELEARIPEHFSPGELPVLANNEVVVATRGGQMLPRPEGYKVRSMADEMNHEYHPFHWVPMMLGMLRDRNVSISDPDILPYFINAEYFGFLYDLLTPDEQDAVDDFRATLIKVE